MPGPESRLPGRRRRLKSAGSATLCGLLASPADHMLPWSHGTRPHGPDARVQRITPNALRRASDGATA